MLMGSNPFNTHLISSDFRLPPIMSIMVACVIGSSVNTVNPKKFSFEFFEFVLNFQWQRLFKNSISSAP